MISWLDNLNRNIMGLEQSFVNVISSVVPWLAPIAPAVLTYQNLTGVLQFATTWAVIVALVVEFLGLSTVSTAFMLWKHNQRYTDPKYRLPIWIPLLAFGFYLFLVVTINVLIEYMTVDYPELAAYTEIASKAMLVFLTVPASAVLVVRAQYARIVQSIQGRYAKAKPHQAKPMQKQAEPVLYTCEKCGASFRTQNALNAHSRFCTQPSVRSQSSDGRNQPASAGEGRE